MKMSIFNGSLYVWQFQLNAKLPENYFPPNYIITIMSFGYFRISQLVEILSWRERQQHRLSRIHLIWAGKSLLHVSGSEKLGNITNYFVNAIGAPWMLFDFDSTICLISIAFMLFDKIVGIVAIFFQNLIRAL